MIRTLRGQWVGLHVGRAGRLPLKSHEASSAFWEDIPRAAEFYKLDGHIIGVVHVVDVVDAEQSEPDQWDCVAGTTYGLHRIVFGEVVPLLEPIEHPGHSQLWLLEEESTSTLLRALMGYAAAIGGSATPTLFDESRPSVTSVSLQSGGDAVIYTNSPTKLQGSPKGALGWMRGQPSVDPTFWFAPQPQLNGGRSALAMDASCSAPLRLTVQALTEGGGPPLGSWPRGSSGPTYMDTAARATSKHSTITGTGTDYMHQVYTNKYISMDGAASSDVTSLSVLADAADAGDSTLGHGGRTSAAASNGHGHGPGGGSDASRATWTLSWPGLTGAGSSSSDLYQVGVGLTSMEERALSMARMASQEAQGLLTSIRMVEQYRHAEAAAASRESQSGDGSRSQGVHRLENIAREQRMLALQQVGLAYVDQLQHIALQARELLFRAMPRLRDIPPELLLSHDETSDFDRRLVSKGLQYQGYVSDNGVPREKLHTGARAGAGGVQDEYHVAVDDDDQRRSVRFAPVASGSGAIPGTLPIDGDGENIGMGVRPEWHFTAHERAGAGTDSTATALTAHGVAWDGRLAGSGPGYKGNGNGNGNGDVRGDNALTAATEHRVDALREQYSRWMQGQGQKKGLGGARGIGGMSSMPGTGSGLGTTPWPPSGRFALNQPLMRSLGYDVSDVMDGLDAPMYASMHDVHRREANQRRERRYRRAGHADDSNAGFAGEGVWEVDTKRRCDAPNVPPTQGDSAHGEGMHRAGYAAGDGGSVTLGEGRGDTKEEDDDVSSAGDSGSTASSEQESVRLGGRSSRSGDGCHDDGSRVAVDTSSGSAGLAGTRSGGSEEDSGSGGDAGATSSGNSSADGKVSTGHASKVLGTRPYRRNHGSASHVPSTSAGSTGMAGAKRARVIESRVAEATDPESPDQPGPKRARGPARAEL